MGYQENPKAPILFPNSLEFGITGSDPYRSMVELAREGMFILDAEARITYANQCLARMLDYRPEEMLGQSIFSFMDEGTGDLVRSQLERRRRGLADVYELSFRKKDGALLPGLISATPLVGLLFSSKN